MKFKELFGSFTNHRVENRSTGTRYGSTGSARSEKWEVGNRDRGNPVNEDPVFNIDDLRNAIPDDEPYSVPGYQSPEHVSVHTKNSDDGGYYDDRANDDEDWGYVNQGNFYNARGYEDEEFGYQNANYVGNDDYGYGNRRNDGYENNRQPRNNNQRNRNDGFYNNNNNVNPNWIPRFLGGGNQRGNQGRNQGGDIRGDRRDN
ncbi:probable serine/threonine-protein kinase clkA [Helianthus annuus]|uniref:probable serine/threonine-protein kinase clkA n=1 Tax=Helianthus annuus TaxID=4232 RepID=UPI001652D247|nr:probable serine/threonine-protein kinase clkA [Helianthus annuus]